MTAMTAMTAATPIAAAPAATRFAALTEEQATAIDAASDLSAGAGLRVRAGAGTGKTSTLLAMASALAPARGIYLAFNRTVAAEARAKFAETPCRPMTFHGLCLGAVQGLISGGPARYDVRADILEAGLLEPHRRAIPRGWSDFAVGLAAMRTFEAFAMSAARAVGANHARMAVVAATGDPDALTARGAAKRAARAVGALTPVLVQIAAAFWQARLADRRFSHDAYVKAVHLDAGLSARAFAGVDYVMVDEAQDMNPVQVAILRAAGVSVIAVGDSAQSIHGWRGAVDALDQFQGEIVTLSRSFRFGADIAGLANRVLGRAPCHMGGIRLVGAGGAQALPAGVPAHAVLARSNMGLISEAGEMHARGFRFHLDRAEDLVAQLASAKALRAGRPGDVRAPDLRPFRTWEDLVEESEGNPAMSRIVQIVEEGRVASVSAMARASRPMESAEVCLMTAHRAKGLEFGAVKMAADWADLDELDERFARAQAVSAAAQVQARQEFNTLYVALTRGIQRVVGAEDLL